MPHERFNEAISKKAKSVDLNTNAVTDKSTCSGQM